MNKDLLETYRNYLSALEYQKEFGNAYFDDIALRVFEKQLLEYNIRVMNKDGICEDEKVKVLKK